MMKDRHYIVYGVLIIILIDFLIVFYTGRSYEGTHQLIGSPVEAILVWIIVIVLGGFGILFRIQRFRFRKQTIIFFILITIISPILLYFSKPVYGYNEGLEEIFTDFPEYRDFDNVELEGLYRTVPVSDGSEKNSSRIIKLYNHYYYYILSYNSEEVYFMRDPYSGRIVQMKQRYWQNP